MKWFKAVIDGEFHAIDDGGVSIDGTSIPDGADTVDEVPADGIASLASREAIDAANPAGYVPFPGDAAESAEPTVADVPEAAASEIADDAVPTEGGTPVEVPTPIDESTTPAE